MVQKRDDLGITEVENAAIDALSGGVPQEEVNQLGGGGVQQVPTETFSQFDDKERYEPEEGEFVDDYVSPEPKESAARKSLHMALASGETESYSRMYDQLAITGHSSTYDLLKQEVDKKSLDSLKTEVEGLASNGEVDKLEETVRGSDKLLNGKQSPTAAALKNASEDLIERSEGFDRTTNHARDYLDGMSSWLEVSEYITNNIIHQKIAQNSLSLTDYAVDVTDVAVFGEQLIGLAKVSSDILGKRYNFLGGSMFRDLALEVRKQPTRELQIAKAQEVADSIEEHSGILVDNDFVKTFALDTFDTMLKSPGGDDKWTRWLGNVFGTMDAIPVVSTLAKAKWLRSLAKAGRSRLSASAKNTVKGELAQLDSATEARAKAAALADGATAAKLGTTPEDELAQILPKVDFDEESMLQGAPNEVFDVIKGTKTKADEVIAYVDNTFEYSPKEYRVKQKRILDTLNDAKITAIARPSESTIVSRNLDRNSVTVKVNYGDETDIPMTLAKAAQMKINLDTAFQNEGLEAVTTLSVKNKATGLIEEFNPAEHFIERKKVTPMTVSDRKGNLHPNPDKRPGESFKALDPVYSGFVVTMKAEAPMRELDTLPGKILGEGSTSGSGYGSRWFINPEEWLDKRILGAARISSDQQRYIKTELFKLIKPFTTLSYRNKKKVANLLERGDAEERVFSFKELEAMGFSNKTMNAYFSTRILEDAMYAVKNQSVRARLVTDGFKSLSIARKGKELLQNGIKEIDSLPPEVSKVFDPYLEKVVDVTDDFIEKMAHKGYKVGRLLRIQDHGNSQFRHILYRNGDTHDLPKNVFPHREGHMFRINSDPYFIDETSIKMLDGKPTPHTRTINAEPNRYKANKSAKALTAHNASAAGKVAYKVRLDRNISLEKSALEIDTDALASGGDSFWFSKRGERLTRFSDDSLSAVEDPITALDRASSSVANVMTHGKWIDTEVARHRKTYGDLEGNGGKKLWRWDENSNSYTFRKETARNFNDPQVRAALKEYEYLEHMKYTPTEGDVIWRDILAQLDSTLAKGGNFWSNVGKGLLNLPTPGRAARGFAFSTTIPLRPFRHIILQGSSSLYLSGIDPVIQAKSLRDGALLSMSMASRKHPLSWEVTKHWAKVHGYKDGEWEEIFDTFVKSGKPYSIDTHIAVGEINYNWARSIPKTALGEAGRMAKNVAMSPISVGKQIGFDTGELFNQSVTWMFAKRQWEKANPGKKFNAHKTYLDEINNNARSLSIDMTKTDALHYQKGILASATQFLSIHNKMFWKVFGKGAHADKTAWGTLKQKGRLITGLAVIWGASGLGAREFYDSWKKENDLDIDPRLDSILSGGFYEYLFNAGIDVAYNQPHGTNQTTFSSSIAPTSSIFTAPRDFFRGMWEGNFLEALSGPAGTQLPNVKKAAQFAAQTWGFEDLDTTEKLLTSMQVFSEEFGIMSDYFRYNAAVAYKENIDKLYMTSKDGRPTAEANATSEQFMKLLFSIGNKNEDELYKHWIPQSREFSGSGKKFRGLVERDGKGMAKWMMRKYMEHGDDPFEFARQVQALTFSLHKANRTYGLAVYQEAQKHFEQNPMFGKFVSQYSEEFMLANPKANIEHLKNMVNNSDFTPEGDKENINRSIDAWSEALETNSELLDRLIEEK